MTECYQTYNKSQVFRYKRYPSCKHFSGHFHVLDKEDRFEIWALSVDRRYRNKGNGTRMLTEFLRQFNANKPIVLYVYKTNEIAIKLYEKVGFTIIGDCHFDSTAYTMQYLPERK